MSTGQSHPLNLRFAAAALVAGMLAAATFIAVSAVPAAAYCTLSDEYTVPISVFWGREEGYGDPQCGTFGTSYPYGNNGHYRGKVFDPYTDGSCVSVRYSDGFYNGVQASSCNSSGITYNFYDQTGDYAAYLRLERNQGTTGWYLSSGY